MNQFIEQFAKQSIAVKAVVLGVLVAVIILINYQAFLTPRKQKLTQLKKKSADLAQKLVENQTVAANYPKFQEEVNILNEQLKQAVALLPNEANMHSILRQISIVAKKTNVDLMFFKPGGSRRRGFYNEISMDLKLDGTYHDIASFIDQVGKISRIINVSNIVFSGVRSARGTILMTVECKANTYMFAGGR